MWGDGGERKINTNAIRKIQERELSEYFTRVVRSARRRADRERQRKESGAKELGT